MYVSPNFKSKKALKEAVKAGQVVSVYSPGPFPAKCCGVDLAPLNDYAKVTQHDCCMVCGKIFPNNATNQREGE